MSVIRKLKIKTADPDTFEDKDLGALAENILIRQNDVNIKLTDKIQDMDENISRIDEIDEVSQSNKKEIMNLDNNILSRLMVTNSDENNTISLTQVSSAELIVINCALNNLINIPNIIIPFEGRTVSYHNCFTYFEDEIKHDIYYDIKVDVQYSFFTIVANITNIIKTDFSKSINFSEPNNSEEPNDSEKPNDSEESNIFIPVITKLDKDQLENYKITVISFKALEIGSRNEIVDE